MSQASKFWRQRHAPTCWKSISPLYRSAAVGGPSTAFGNQRCDHTSYTGYDMIYLLIAIGLTPGGSSTVHIYKTNNTQNNTTILEQCGPCPVLASYTLAFALQPRKKHGKLHFNSLQNTFTRRTPC